MPRRSLVLMVMALIIILGILGDLGWRSATRPRFVVEVAGKVVGAIRKPEVAQAALDTVMKQITPEMQLKVNLPETLTVRSVRPGERLAAATPEAIEIALAGQIPSFVRAIAITVNGNDVVAVESEQAAQVVRDRILDEYRQTVLKDASAVEQLKFQETIAWHPKLVKEENVRSIDEAMNILKLGTNRLVTYVVKSGDTGWDIARSYNLTTDQLARANPTADIENLQIGQVLNVTYKEPYVHTVSVSKKVVTEPIPFTEEIQRDANLWPWQYQIVTPGVPGTRQLTIREYRENGTVIKTEVLSNEVKTQPKAQVAKQGTKQIPDLGTGQLVFPVVGVLTSPFGPRWGELGDFHTGIDIAAPAGTPVLAADSGMVVFRGWSGNYGNLLKIDHGGGKLETWYGHLSAFNVSVGDTVKKGQVIGYVGNTGFSTGPHLHYEVRDHGTAVDPLGYYK